MSVVRRICSSHRDFTITQTPQKRTFFTIAADSGRDASCDVTAKSIQSKPSCLEHECKRKVSFPNKHHREGARETVLPVRVVFRKSHRKHRRRKKHARGKSSIFGCKKKKKKPCEILYGLICSMLEDFRVFKCYLLTQKCERKKSCFTGCVC